MATDVDQTTETTRVAREYFAALARGERDAQQRYYAADARAHIHGVLGPARPRRDASPSSPSSSTPSPTGASRSSRPWPRATAWRCAGAPARPSPGRAASWASSPTARASTSRASTSSADPRRADRAHRRLHERRRARSPARRAAAAGLGHRGADGHGLQPDHPRQAPRSPPAPSPWPMASGSCAAASHKTMNVYLRARRRRRDALRRGDQGDDRAVAAAGASLGGITRVVLGHGHPDHRGVAPYLGAPVLCHADNREDAEGDGGMRYFDFSKLRPYAQAALPLPAEDLGRRARGDRRHGGRGRRAGRLRGRGPARPRPGAHRPVARGRPPGAGQRLLLHARSADRDPRPPARSPSPRSTTTPSRRAPRSASSRRWSRPPRGRATPSR